MTFTSRRRNSFIFAAGFLAFFGPLGFSQLASERQPTAAELSKYDVNRNGRLDPSELATMEAARRARPVEARSDSSGSSGDTVTLSPFEVSGAGDHGYYGANTMSGTRLNSRIEDLASSITVVTKEQMEDFAMLDINDIFNYEAGTEGTGNFTDLSFNNNGDPVDNTQLDPNNANRVRGLGSANISFGSFGPPDIALF